MRSCVHGYRGVEKFTALMDMRRKILSYTYRKDYTYERGGF